MKLPEYAHPQRRQRPPAPTPNAAPLNRLQVLARLRSNPLTIWTHRHFNEAVLAGPGLRGYGTILSDPDAIKHVLVDNAANYPKDALQRKILAPGLGEGLLTAEGDAWRRARRTLAPIFTPKRTAGFADAMRAGADRLVARWTRRSQGSAAGVMLDISEEMTRGTFDILSATLFSNGIDGDADGFSRALTRYFETQGRVDPLDLLGAPEWLPRIGTMMARPAIQFFETRVREIVAKRRALIATGAPAPNDLLTALLEAQDPETGQGLSELEVGANIVTFIGAGHETTANTLTWALYLLSRAPDIRVRVEEEADTVAALETEPADWLASLPMTRAVIEEAMRLYPPVAILSRSAIAADVANGHVIPKGSLVVVSPWVLHRHKLLWADPELFVPERFLPGAREAIGRFQFLPFGAGPRVCIGMGFALLEAVIVLSSLSRRFRMTYAGERPPVPVQRITLRPAGGMPMRITRREQTG